MPAPSPCQGFFLRVKDSYFGWTKVKCPLVSSQPSGAHVDKSSATPAKRYKVRLWHLLFLAVLVIATFGLAWWQWTRYQSGSGTFQNLGYAFQWPMFGAFFVFAYKKILEYENEKYAIEHGELNEGAGVAVPDTAEEEEAAPHARPYVAPKRDAGPEEISEDFLPKRPQMSVEEFNRQFEPRRRKAQGTESDRDETAR